jgi:hypothetical protein
MDLAYSVLFQQGLIFEDKFYLCQEDKFDLKCHFLAHPLQQILQKSSSYNWKKKIITYYYLITLYFRNQNRLQYSIVYTVE